MYMKQCSTISCTNKVKNSYNYCYECNKKSNDNSDDSVCSDTIYKKETIPKTVRNCVWLNYFGDNRSGLCCCCQREIISISNFHCGHIKAFVNGGTTTLDNLKPICMLCNTSMSTYDMHEFIKKYNLHWSPKNNI